MTASTTAIVFAFAIISLSVIFHGNVFAQESISAKGYSLGTTTIIEFTNTSTQDVKTFRMWLGSDAQFKSFKSEDGWTGKKTPEGVIVFSSDEPVMPGESIKFGIKTDAEKPGISWRALDKNEEVIFSSKTTPGELSQTTGQTPSKDSTSNMQSAIFRLVPEKPNVGSTIRVAGEGFQAKQSYQLFLDSVKLENISTDDNGNFMITAKIPDNTPADRVNFIVKDNLGNEKTVSIRIEQKQTRALETVPLKITGLPTEIDRGEVVLIKGTATPGSSVTATITTPEGKRLSTNATKTDAQGKWEYSTIVDLKAPLGEYSAEITDGTQTIKKTWKVVLSKQIQITPAKVVFDPGDTFKFNGTGIPNQQIELVIENPLGSEVISDVLNTDAQGAFTFESPTDFSFIEGTYVLFAYQGSESDIVFFGLGESPKEQVQQNMDKLNYKSNEKAQISITGPPNSRLNILIIDPSDKEKFTDSIELGPDGKRKYQLDLKGYTTGVYTLVISGAGTKTSENFSVGLQYGSGQIQFRTTKSSYSPGEQVIGLGSSSPNALLNLYLKDPDGKSVKSREAYTDKKGIITFDSFRIPSDAKSGVWSIRVESGANYAEPQFTVHQSIAEGLTVFVEKVETIVDGKLVTIKGFGAPVSTSVIITITNPDGKSEEFTVKSTKEGEYSLLWTSGRQPVTGTYKVVAADNTKREASTTFDITK